MIALNDKKQVVRRVFDTVANFFHGLKEKRWRQAWEKKDDEGMRAI